MRAHIVHNPMAGQLPTAGLVRRAAERLRAEGWTVTVGRTGGLADVAAQARQAVAEGCEVAFVAGGDGTLGRAAEGLAGSDTALGVLPLGTANVWAQQIGLSKPALPRARDVEQAVAAQTRGRIQAVDLGRCGGRYFLLWAGTGLDEFVIGRLEPRSRAEKLFGRPYYLLKGLLMAIPFRGRRMSVRVDGQEVAGQMLLAVVSNIRRYGGGWFRLDHSARVDDGQLEVWVFDGESYREALVHLARLWTDRHYGRPNVRRLSGQRIEIKTDPPGRLTFDGDLVDLSTPLTIEVAQRALKVLVPREAHAGLFAHPPVATL